MFDVISIGTAIVDIFVKSDEFILDNNLLSLESSSKNEINESLITSGGGATNSTVSFSRLGLKSIPISLIGTDHLCNFITDDLKTNKISPNLLVKDSSNPTDFSVILVAPDGSRSILTNRGNSSLEESQIDWTKLTKTKWFYITSLEGNLDLLEKLIGFAKENNIKIALNPGNRELSKPKKIIPLLKFVDFLLLNKTEGQILTELEFDNDQFWPKILSYGSQITAITDSRNGAYVITPQSHLFSPIVKVKPVDETGAGDAFGSAFVAALIYKLDLQEALFWGIKNSASVVTKLGAKPGLLTLKLIKK